MAIPDKGLSAFRKYELVSAALKETLKYLHRATRKRNPMLARRLHARGGHGPELVLEVDFRPPSAEHLTGPRGCQNAKFQGQRRYRLPPTQLGNERRYFVIGKGRVMAARQLGALREKLIKMAAPSCRVCFIAWDMPLGSRGVDYRFDPPAKTRRGFGLRLPDRLQYGKDRVGVDLIDRARAQWRGINLQRHFPLGAMLVVTPFRTLRFN